MFCLFFVIFVLFVVSNQTIDSDLRFVDNRDEFFISGPPTFSPSYLLIFFYSFFHLCHA